MKILSILNLFELDKIDEIYADEKIINFISLEKFNFIRKIDYNNSSKINKKTLFLIDYKNFIKNYKNYYLNNKSLYLLILNTPTFFFNYNIKTKFRSETYYILPNILKPEILVSKKDVKYLFRYWSIKKNNILTNMFNYLTLFLLKYKIALFLIPKVMILYEK